MYHRRQAYTAQREDKRAQRTPSAPPMPETAAASPTQVPLAPPDGSRGRASHSPTAASPFPPASIDTLIDALGQLSRLVLDDALREDLGVHLELLKAHPALGTGGARKPAQVQRGRTPSAPVRNGAPPTYPSPRRRSASLGKDGPVGQAKDVTRVLSEPPSDPWVEVLGTDTVGSVRTQCACERPSTRPARVKGPAEDAEPDRVVVPQTRRN